MAATEFEGALLDMGGMALPVANEENKKLETGVRRKEREIAALQLQIDEHKDRAQAIRDHLKNVRQELQHTQVASVTQSYMYSMNRVHACQKWK